jgi:hypothetical protein
VHVANALPTNITLNVVAVRQMTSEGKSDKMAFNMEVRMKGVQLNTSLRKKLHSMTFIDAC